MTDDRSVIEKIKAVLDEDSSDTNVSEEDAQLIRKIKALMDSAGDRMEELELAAMRIEDEENAETVEEIPEELADAEEPAEELFEEAETVEEELPVEEAPEEDKVEEETDEAAEETVAAEVEVAAAEEEPADAELEITPLPEPPKGEHKKHWMTVIEDRFNAWNPKSRAGRFIAKDRHNATLAAVIALAVLCGGWQLIEYLIPQNVTVQYQSFGDSRDIEVSTRATDVKGALADCDLKVGEKDYIYPALDHPIKSGDKITFKKAVKTKAMIAGKKQTFWKIPGTIEDNLKYNDISYDKDDILIPKRGTEVGAKTNVGMKELHTVVKEKKETRKAKSVVVLDPSISSGRVQTTKGHDGKGIYTYKTTYINGKKVKTEKSLKKWIDKPVDNALRLGTSLTGHRGTYKVTREFVANTTAYYMGENAHGAAGGHCVYGTCAVDPRVIPYGTVLFVEGYGVAVANDCGGAIKGDKLDLWMHSYNESCQWGRRFVKTYVLSK